MSSSLTVIKVGGSLLRDAGDLRRAAAAMTERRRQGDALLIVASALQGVTDALQRAALEALDSRQRDVSRIFESLRQRHEEIARAVAEDNRALTQIQGILDTVEALLGSIRSAGKLSDRTYARLLSAGERLSVPLLAAAIRAAGMDARGIDSEELELQATGSPRAGVCDVAGSSEGLAKIQPELADRVVVLTGFYGIDADGEVVLFGRGGSDDTAAAVAAGLGATVLELWKDVPGFMTADPRYVEQAQVVPELSFDEVAQLSAYGSYIVHSGCLEPLRGGSTKISICSLGGANGASTRVVETRQPNGHKLVAMTGRRGSAELGLQLRLDERALVGEILDHLAKAEVPVDWITASASELRFKLVEPDAGRAQRVLRALVDQRLEVNRFPSLIGVVGDGVASDTAISSSMLACLSGLRADGDLQVRRSGHAGLSCHSIHQEDLVPALNALHQHFFVTN